MPFCKNSKLLGAPIALTPFPLRSKNQLTIDCDTPAVTNIEMPSTIKCETSMGQKFTIAISVGYMWCSVDLYVQVDDRLHIGVSSFKRLQTRRCWYFEDARRLAATWRSNLRRCPPILSDLDCPLSTTIDQSVEVELEFGLFSKHSFEDSKFLGNQIQQISNFVALPPESREQPENFLRSGDHVIVWRGGGWSGHFYHHDGIYVGNGKVVHMTPSTEAPKLINGQLLNGRVSKISWENFIGRDPCTAIFVIIYELRMRRAEYVKGFAEICVDYDEKHLYDLFENNCQHFATICATGVKFSRQADGAYVPGFVKRLLKKYSDSSSSSASSI